MKNNIPFKLLLFVIALLVINAIHAQINTAEITNYLSSVYSADDPGISMLIAKDGKPIYRKAFGKASLELDVQMNPENVFELGSITKQFTAE